MTTATPPVGGHVHKKQFFLLTPSLNIYLYISRIRIIFIYDFKEKIALFSLLALNLILNTKHRDILHFFNTSFFVPSSLHNYLTPSIKATNALQNPIYLYISLQKPLQQRRMMSYTKRRAIKRPAIKAHSEDFAKDI